MSHIEQALYAYDEVEHEILYAVIDRLRSQGYSTQKRDRETTSVMFLEFFKTKPCSKCERVGLVPKHHRFLCLVCWAMHSEEPVPTRYHMEEDTREEPKLSEWDFEDEDSWNIVYNEVVYSSKTMSQAHLRAILDS